MPRRATSLTLPVHKPVAQPLPSHFGLCTLFENACQGLSITPEQLQQELEAGGDTPDLVSGALTPAALRQIAETLNTMQRAGDEDRRSQSTIGSEALAQADDARS